ncbi:hypothetical protein GCM10027425_09160 [Alteromonas gracilis]
MSNRHLTTDELIAKIDASLEQATPARTPRACSSLPTQGTPPTTTTTPEPAGFDQLRQVLKQLGMRLEPWQVAWLDTVLQSEPDQPPYVARHSAGSRPRP